VAFIETWLDSRRSLATAAGAVGESVTAGIFQPLGNQRLFFCTAGQTRSSPLLAYQEKRVRTCGGSWLEAGSRKLEALFIFNCIRTRAR
jgi:hypothetical protein